MLDTKEVVSTERITEPAKRWRNKFQAQQLIHAHDRHGVFTREYARGEITDTSPLYPSKEIAEEGAAEFLADNIRRHHNNAWLYLGAFPVTE